MWSRGVIDVTYVLILLPDTDSKLDYFNRKQGYSVNTQTVIGYNLECPSVATGYPNNMCDTRILRNTCLFQRTKNWNALGSPLDVIEGFKIRQLILVDSANPLTF